MGMVGREYKTKNGYRYGFNGKENDNEVKGVEGSQQDYGMRISDPRLGKFLSVDPLTKNYPWYTPYQFAGNKPINSIDLDGQEEFESYGAYKAKFGDQAQEKGKMNGSDGAWLKSDRKNKTSTWSNAMEAITKNSWTDRFTSFYEGIGFDSERGIKTTAVENKYNFHIVRDYYNWVQHQLDEKGFGSRWAMGASCLSDELADTYNEGIKSGGFAVMGGLLKELSQNIAGYAVGKFSSILYGGEKVGSGKDDWYAWDANFITEEQVTKIAPGTYERYKGTRALNQLNDLSRKEGFIGTLAIPKHFFPSFKTFGVNVNDLNTQFGAQGRYNIPLLMLYPFTHSGKSGLKLTNEQSKEIWKAHNEVNSYYKNSMKY
jgi:RHS repeat-associated protein